MVEDLGWVFEELARRHAAHLTASGALPEDLVVGRWWSTTGPPAEVDVLGMRRSRSVLLGEAKWQERPLGQHEVAQLLAKAGAVPNPVDEPLLALWGRGGLEPHLRSDLVRGYDLDQLLSAGTKPIAAERGMRRADRSSLRSRSLTRSA